ncbi:SGNH/GDSL hydrolase family protein [Microbacterium sp. Au-Mic1]|uniref:SGNH/GDSL hydrolase family protein n=1 Tax=Microbacterium sp. Au-Mic1 TaxID=2906457 RepID=UPI001E358543|nr:SGNH/GDSL hydrolase family protein [Microbacterium sp. Au-Mic1]MCE4026423.1 SGNH/GDSL hydrolase family protein [Microbacterium sp. Au-Mic1]
MRVTFIGDSITDAGRDRADHGSFGDGYVSLLAPGLIAGGATVRNLGIAGNRVADLAARWDAELMPTAPELLTVFVGVNEMLRRYDSADPTPTERYAATYRRLLDAVMAAHEPRLILMEPFFLPPAPEQRAWRDDLDEKRAVVAEIAGEFGAAFVPLDGVFAAAARDRAPAELAPDGVHPTPVGSRLIADAWTAASIISDSR